MVPEQDLSFESAEEIETIPRTRRVTDNVAEAHHPGEADPGEIGEHRLERFQV
jgi:hypothetical protein